jgi:hypothetical protein
MPDLCTRHFVHKQSAELELVALLPAALPTIGLCHSPANYHVLQPCQVLHTVALLIIMGPPGARGESCTHRNAGKQELFCTLL